MDISPLKPARKESVMDALALLQVRVISGLQNFADPVKDPEGSTPTTPRIEEDVLARVRRLGSEAREEMRGSEDAHLIEGVFRAIYRLVDARIAGQPRAMRRALSRAENGRQIIERMIADSRANASSMVNYLAAMTVALSDRHISPYDAIDLVGSGGGVPTSTQYAWHRNTRLVLAEIKYNH